MMVYRLTHLDACESDALRSDLRLFFHRARRLKAQLRTPVYGLNRLQRMRCIDNLYAIERLEREYYALSHPDDVRELYRFVQRYVKLDDAMLSRAMAQEKIRFPSLFVC
jgi:hypothetical protein